jgi:hypothetical protein
LTPTSTPQIGTDSVPLSCNAPDGKPPRFVSWPTAVIRLLIVAAYFESAASGIEAMPNEFWTH